MLATRTLTFALLATTHAMMACGRTSAWAQRRVERGTLITKPARAFTPADAGIPFTRVWVEHDKRRLEAWLVRGADSVSVNAAVFVAHGTGETLSDWVHAQALLRRHGISSFVFDYAGFGNSSGKPSARALEDDLLAAYNVFSGLLPPATRRVALGFSLGSGVLLATQDRLHPPIDAIVVASAFSTARQAAVRRRFFPGILAYLAPDSLWNNMAAARRVKVPLLVVHSDADKAFPLSMARQIAEANGQPNNLHVQHGFRHNALYASVTEAQWAAIVSFVRTDTSKTKKHN